MKILHQCQLRLKFVKGLAGLKASDVKTQDSSLEAQEDLIRLQTPGW